MAGNLNRELDRFVEAQPLGHVAFDTGFLLSRDPPTVRGPDVAFLSWERIPPEGPPRGFWETAPDLAVEVLSPSNTAAKINDKVLEYLAADVLPGFRLAVSEIFEMPWSDGPSGDVQSAR